MIDILRLHASPLVIAVWAVVFCVDEHHRTVDLFVLATIAASVVLQMRELIRLYRRRDGRQ